MATKKTNALVPVNTQVSKMPQVLPPEKPLLELSVGLEKADWYFGLLEGYDIPDEQEYVGATDLLKKVAADLKLWEDQQELATRKLKDEYDMRRAVFSPVLKRLKSARDKLKDMVGAYAIKLEQARRAQLLLAASAVTPLEATQLVRESRTSAAPQVKGITNKISAVAQLVNPQLVPEEFLVKVVDMDLVQAAVDKGRRDIPGIEVVEKSSTTVRKA